MILPEKMDTHLRIYTLLFTFIFCTYCKAQTKDAISSHGPKHITRNIIQDRKGSIWMASFGGIFRYDGNTFSNITGKVSSASFFSILEDRKGDLWFGSIGSGVFRYDGRSFQNFTTKEGLVNNEITCIYEDHTGNIWFGVNGGVSCYDGKSFLNYMMSGDSMVEERTGKTFPDYTRPPNEVNSIIEDKTGRFWFATRGKTFVYDGRKFTVTTHDGKPFSNVRTMIEDKAGNIWLGGENGLWRFDGKTFTNFNQNFVGYIYEDKKGNLWTSSAKDNIRDWVLSRYDGKSLSDKKTTTEIKAVFENNQNMFFGIVGSSDGNIWFGALDGVRRYDGNTIADFK